MHQTNKQTHQKKSRKRKSKRIEKKQNNTVQHSSTQFNTKKRKKKKRKTTKQHKTTQNNTQFNTVQHSSTQFNTVQHSSTQFNTVQHSSTQFNTVQHSSTQFNTVQHSSTQFNTVQHQTTQFNTKQHSSTQNNTVQHSLTQNNTKQCNHNRKIGKEKVGNEKVKGQKKEEKNSHQAWHLLLDALAWPWSFGGIWHTLPWSHSTSVFSCMPAESCARKLPDDWPNLTFLPHEHLTSVKFLLTLFWVFVHSSAHQPPLLGVDLTSWMPTFSLDLQWQRSLSRFLLPLLMTFLFVFSNIFCLWLCFWKNASWRKNTIKTPIQSITLTSDISLSAITSQITLSSVKATFWCQKWLPTCWPSLSDQSSSRDFVKGWWYPRRKSAAESEWSVWWQGYVDAEEYVLCSVNCALCVFIWVTKSETPL